MLGVKISGLSGTWALNPELRNSQITSSQWHGNPSEWRVYFEYWEGDVKANKLESQQLYMFRSYMSQ